MGFLDKLFGRAKETAGDVADKTAPVVDKTQGAAGQAWDKTSDVASDVADKAKDVVGSASGEAKEKVDETTGGQGSPPSAA